MRNHRLLIYKLLTVLLLVVATGVSMSAMVKVAVNGCPAFADDSAKIMLASVPQAWFGNTVEATLNSRGNSRVVSIDGISIDDTSAFTFEDINGAKSWQVVIAEGDSITPYTLQFTYLPIVLLEGNPGYEYTSGSMAIAEPGTTETENMLARIKWRGKAQLQHQVCQRKR